MLKPFMEARCKPDNVWQQSTQNISYFILYLVKYVEFFNFYVSIHKFHIHINMNNTSRNIVGCTEIANTISSFHMFYLYIDDDFPNFSGGMVVQWLVTGRF